jgi:hypothetical protein
VQFVQKLPAAVKKGFVGSNRPRITLPHMHSIKGLPMPSRRGCPEASRTHSSFSRSTKLSGKPLVSK